MTQEEKAKAYDEVLKKARMFYKDEDEHVDNEVNSLLEVLFPELKESENEKMWKLIKKYVHYNISDTELEADHITRKQLESWLEKQGEKRPDEEYNITGIHSKHAEGKLDEWIKNLKSVNEMKVEPKFNEGEWIVWQGKCYRVNYNGCGYELVDQDGLIAALEYGTVDENAHLWSIAKDAKPGDVLVTKNKNIFILKSISDCTIYVYCGLYFKKFIRACGAVAVGNNVEQISGDFTPATKEQRELLLLKIKEEGYKWNARALVLKKINSKNRRTTSSTMEGRY